MKLKILSVLTLSVIIFGSSGIISLIPAQAATITIDNFNSPAGGGSPTPWALTPTAATIIPFSDEALAPGDQIGLERSGEFEVEFAPASPPISQLDIVASMVRMSIPTQVDAKFFFLWDDLGAGLDFSGTSDFVVQASDADLGIPINFILSDGTNSGSVMRTMPAIGSCCTEEFFPLSEVESSSLPGPIDLTKVTSVKMEVDPPGKADLTIENIFTRMDMVGGEMFPTNMSALLLAGVSVNLMWILPTIAAIGIAGFVVSRRIR